MLDCRPKFNSAVQKARNANARLNNAARNAAENWRTKDQKFYYELVSSAEDLLDACEELDKVVTVVEVVGQDVWLNLPILRREIENWRWSANFQGNASKQYRAA